MGRRDRAQEPQSWEPRKPREAAPPPNTWPTPPQGPPPTDYHQAEPSPQPKKRRRVFLWVFLAVQILFLIWVITGIASNDDNPESCEGLTGDSLKLCEDAGDLGTTIGVGFIVGFWVAADFILSLTYVIYRLATRQPRTEGVQLRR
ncbi:hypothetical protein U5640_21480 [Streptomyces sp. SS7]|uniref:hypothetical protein n=1 Tax=Streptomyces sp. SS7 TaxID=3108485 RepID=UPI0030ED1069